MINEPVNRRQFLQASGVAVAGMALVASGAMLIAPDGAWAMTVSTLDTATAQSLLVMSRRLYPHPALADMYYAKVVSDLDEKAKGDATLAGQLKDGAGRLDKAMGVRWLELSEGNQTIVLTGMAGTPFFETVRGATVASLYNNPLVWRHFGYEGASFPYGGYKLRGFNDLAWLPDPPEAASPPAY